MAKRPAGAPEQRIEYERLDRVLRWPGNPKGHDLAVIRASLGKFGFVGALLVDETTGRLVAGHGRVEALEAMRAAGEPAPARIRVVDDGMWLVPVLRGISFGSEAEAEAFLLVDNRATELGGWQEKELLPMLRRLESNSADLRRLSGFDDKALKLLIQREQQALKWDTPDVLPNAKPRCKVGELWTLGRHRLICGDSTDAEVVQLVLDGARPYLMMTDPPYGVEYDARNRPAPRGLTTARRISNDDRADWQQALRLFPGDVAYVWYASAAVDINAVLIGFGFEGRVEIIWAKDAATFGRGHYWWQHEPMMYAVRKGSKAEWIGDHDVTVWQARSPLIGGAAAQGEDARTQHPNQKPVALLKRAIGHHMGDVYDPFLGSGSTLIACEALERSCYGIELDPRWCDTIIARWEALTGGKASRVDQRAVTP